MSNSIRFKEKRGGLKVRFSIGAKLITIISIIVLFSLGSITALVSWLVREDLKLSAEDNNFEVNRRAAAEAEQTLEKTRQLSLMFSRSAELAKSEEAVQEEAGYFFSLNPQIAALFFAAAPSAAEEGQAFVNERFFLSRGIEASLAHAYRAASGAAMENAALGQTALLNATPQFSGGQVSTPLAALFFPARGGGGCALFSSDGLNESFGMGVNTSYLINSGGDVVADADMERVKNLTNLAEQDIVRRIFDSPDRNKQMLIELDNRRHYLAYTRLDTAGSVVITTIEYDKVFEGINATTRRNLYLTAAVLFLSIMCVWFFAKTISVPLKALAAAARSIEGGVFNVELQPAGGDEIGMLTSSFGKMSAALGVFGKFTNRDIAVQAMRGQIKPGGQPKHATIFFSDIRGFTEKSENFVKAFGDEASDRIVFWLNEYLTRMVECVEKTNGTIDKFIGDAVMAHWGTASTSGSPKQDALNCVMSALLMRVALYNINKTRKKENLGNPPISIGCGINTGIVTAGQIGSELRMEYTVIGDPVNLASRVEALNKPLGTDILITEDTWNMIKEHVIVEEMPPVTVKGKEKPVRLFAVVNLSAVKTVPRNLAQVRKILGVKPPDISKADVNAEEHKYKIGGK